MGSNIHQCFFGYMIGKYVGQKDLAAMLTFMQSVSLIPKVNLMITQVRKHASKRSILAL